MSPDPGPASGPSASISETIAHDARAVAAGTYIEAKYVTVAGAGSKPESLPGNNFASAGVSQNKDFVNRPEQLDAMHKALSAGGTVALIHAYCGEGGVGKTELAAEYAFRHADDYDGRWWVNASKETLEQSLGALAADLGSPPGPQDSPADIRRRIAGALSSGRHLVVLDNVDSKELYATLAFPENCCVLVTTRLGGLLPGKEIDVPVLTREQSVELLTQHRKDLRQAQHADDLNAVAVFLGDHALAVKLAAAYLRRTKLSPAKLLERLQGVEFGDMQHPLTRQDVAEAGKYGMGVAASLSLLFPELRCGASMPALGACALVAPEEIPVELIGDALNFDETEVDEAIAELASLSIVDLELDERGRRTVSVHRLTQSVMRGKMDEESRVAARDALMGAMLGHLDGMTDYTRWDEHDRFTAHAEALVERVPDAEAGGASSFPEAFPMLLGRLAHLHRNRLRYRDAATYYELAERVGRAVLGGSHAELAVILTNAGDLYRVSGRLEKALVCLRDAERIGRMVYGDDHPAVAVCVNNIGSVLYSQGDLAGALASYRDAERIGRAVYGDDHPTVAVYVNNIGLVLKAQGDLGGALASYRDAERVDRAAYGDDHPMVAVRVNNIGGVLQSRGDLAGALASYREAERVDRAVYGDDHPEVATDVSNIGSVLLAQGDLDGARRCCEEAFRIVLRAYGPRGENVVTIAFNLMAVEIDPLPIAEEIAGPEVATQFREACMEELARRKAAASNSPPSA